MPGQTDSEALGANSRWLPFYPAIKTIGNDLNISARTVDNRRVHILSKMRAKSLSDLGRSMTRATPIFAESGNNARID